VLLPCKREIRVLDENDSTPVIEISQLRFEYSSSSQWALSIPHLSIQRGERVALVGESGSGKSTLADLILGLQEFNSGSITLSVRSMNKIGYVPQKLSLLNRSILENVALGVPAKFIDHEKVRDSLQKTGMLEFVESLPNKLKTNVGERGVFLSGGQMQRIAISRALYTSPELLLLDEATSALDSASEDLITNVLKNVEQSVTTIVIAHRLSTVLSVDRVIYLKSGEILGQGTFNEVRTQIPDFDQQANLMGL
jgi:ABC-type bacteriocin/lantibiotic exporter with double-glycine peptidase domain